MVVAIGVGDTIYDPLSSCRRAPIVSHVRYSCDSVMRCLRYGVVACLYPAQHGNNDNTQYYYPTDSF